MEPRALSGLLLTSCLVLTGPAASQEPPAEPEAAETAAAAPAEDPAPGPGAPGEHHEHLDRLVGEWDLDLKVWNDPSGEPEVTAGTAESRWILGGRFVHTVYRAELFGRPFEAWSVEGYDNQESEYVGTWRDTQGTYTLVYRGKCERPPAAEDEEAEAAPEGSVRTMKAKITDPTSGDDLRLETVITVTDAGAYTLESFVVLSEDDRFKNMEMTARRKAEAGNP